MGCFGCKNLSPRSASKWRKQNKGETELLLHGKKCGNFFV